MTESVTVGVRIRPLNERELSSRNPHLAFDVNEDNEIQRVHRSVSSAPAHNYRYDNVFGNQSTNEQVYNDLACPIVDSALAGFNATIFAYGQTSSGKTHSMLGYDADPGITPRAIRHVVEAAGNSRTREFLIRVYYVEIYNDKIKDLMNEAAKDLRVLEDKAGRTFVDASETIVRSYDDAMKVLETGQQARQVGETKMNSNSSRSHTVFTILIESKSTNKSEDKVAFRASCLNLVDLAGSERAKSTGATGKALQEGSHINQSLLTLGTIINKLSQAGPDSKLGHLPYRDSKLTRLLRPALGGNAKTAILCAVTPSANHIEETVSTLKFAERAKKVTNKIKRNEIIDYKAKYHQLSTENDVLRERYEQLQAQLQQVKQEQDEQVAAKVAFAQKEAATAAANSILKKDKHSPISPTPSVVSPTACSPNSMAVSDVSEHADEQDHDAVMTSDEECDVELSMNYAERKESGVEAEEEKDDTTTRSDDKTMDTKQEDKPNLAETKTPSAASSSDGQLKRATTSSSRGPLKRAATSSNGQLKRSTTTRQEAETVIRKLHSDTELLIKKEVELRNAQEEMAFLKARVEEVELESEDLKTRLRVKANESSSLRSRAIEFRTEARQARTYEKQLFRTIRYAFDELREARIQLDKSRKKGAHVILAENQLAALSDQLKRYIELGETALKQDLQVRHERAIVLRPPGHVIQSNNGTATGQSTDNKEMEKAAAIALRLGGVNQSEVAGFAFRPVTTKKDSGKQQAGNENDNDNENAIKLEPRMMGTIATPGKIFDSTSSSASSVSTRRRPRPLPEDMVADIDDDENSNSNVHISKHDARDQWDEVNLDGDLSDGDTDDLHFRGGFIGSTGTGSGTASKLPPLANQHRRSSTASTASSVTSTGKGRNGGTPQKSAKEGYWQQALRRFYGYGQQHDVMDVMVGGHKVDGKSTSGVAR